jgi:hypothetical protein
MERLIKITQNLSSVHAVTWQRDELGTQCGASFVSYRFELAIAEAHAEKVLIDTLHEAVIVTAALHSMQNTVHPVKTTTKL